MKSEIFEVNQDDVAEAVAKILDKLPVQKGEEEVEFPTKVDFYKKPDPSEPVTIRPMTFEDEKFLSNVSNPAEAVKLLLDRCVSNVYYSQLLPSDRLYLLIKLRAISVSPKYEAKAICENCGNNSVVELDLLKDFPIKKAKNLKEETEITLVGSKVKVKTKLVRVSDLDKDELVVINEPWRFVVSVDGQDHPAVIKKVLENLSRDAMHQIIASIQPDIGIDTKFLLHCSKCTHETLVAMKISEDFFTVNLKK
jgi:hypothetical protein